MSLSPDRHDNVLLRDPSTTNDWAHRDLSAPPKRLPRTQLDVPGASQLPHASLRAMTHRAKTRSRLNIGCSRGAFRGAVHDQGERCERQALQSENGVLDSSCCILKQGRRSRVAAREFVPTYRMRHSGSARHPWDPGELVVRTHPSRPRPQMAPDSSGPFGRWIAMHDVHLRGRISRVQYRYPGHDTNSLGPDFPGSRAGAPRAARATPMAGGRNGFVRSAARRVSLGSQRRLYTRRAWALGQCE
ncbi:hypothetical protein C2E23DRAFT_828133 [Lenzites betulinus]|nr:hypothetical protein C2E23DRAFT_828133 [Lenzites betulinus]